jgi:hypothetical protein
MGAWRSPTITGGSATGFSVTGAWAEPLPMMDIVPSIRGRTPVVSVALIDGLQDIDPEKDKLGAEISRYSKHSTGCVGGKSRKREVARYHSRY